MNKLTNILDVGQWGLIAITLGDIQGILNVILLCISIGVGLLSLALKLRQYLKDGKISKEEKEDLENDIEEIKEKVQNFKDK